MHLAKQFCDFNSWDERLGSGQEPTVAAVGATVSVNYNTGPWTFGGYYQWATGEGDVQIVGSDRLQVFELGASYRFSTHWRLYSAAYYYDLSDEIGQLSTSPHKGTVWLLGIRAAL